MRLSWLAVPALILLSGCAGMDPAAGYRAAARQLKFTLDRVDPSLQVALPLDRSRLALRVTLGAENPTAVRFRARSLSGRIFLDADGATYAIGELASAQALDLKPSARTPVVVDLSFTYNDVRQSWNTVRMVGGGARPGTWRLEGKAELEVMGIAFAVPLQVQKRVSGQ